MSTGIQVIMQMVQKQIGTMKDCKPRMDQHRKWKTEGIVLEGVKIGQYISDL
jgi:hypothetical protein